MLLSHHSQDGFPQLFGDGTGEFSDLLALLQEDKRRHHGNVVVLSNILDSPSLDVSLQENTVGKFPSQFFENGSHHLAGSAPGGEEVDHH